MTRLSYRCKLPALYGIGKIYRFRCRPTRFSYEVEVSGKGDLETVNYFGGYYSGQVRWGSGFFPSGQNFKQGFNPEPATSEVYTFAADLSSNINLTGVPLPGKGDWFFTPPPFCYAFELSQGWLGTGIEAQPGENRFTEFQYQGGNGSFHLALKYEGHTHVQGTYRLPDISFDFGPDPYTLLANHVLQLRSKGLVPIGQVNNRPAWWYEPIFCGWGAQCHLAKISGGSSPQFATQASYEGFLDVLVQQGIQPGTIVIDDKWQLAYGENQVDPAKWPDLPGFIQHRHEQGQRVLLWLKSLGFRGHPGGRVHPQRRGSPVGGRPHQSRLCAPAAPVRPAHDLC